MNTTKHAFHYGDRRIDYSLIRSRRLKTSELVVDENGVVIRVPVNKPVVEIDKILEKKAHWIYEKKQQYDKVQKQIKKSNFRIGSTLPYLGKNYRIAKGKRKGNECLELRQGRFLISTKDLSQNNITNMYKKWLRQKSENIFPVKVTEYSKRLGIQRPRTIITKNMRNRWGSVTKDGVLNLNLNLLKAPNKVIDYIIIHELCHFTIRKHSHHFWDLLGRSMPRYKDSIVWLENNASILIE